MATNKLIIKLTADQQKQIKGATGGSVSELTIRFRDTAGLSDEDLDKVSGGGGQLSYGKVFEIEDFSFD